MFNFIKELFNKQASSRFNDAVLTSKFDALTYGRSTPDNFDTHLKAYNNEVYVYGCIYLIGSTIAGLPYQLYKLDANKKKIIVRNSQVESLFETPNENDENSTYGNLIEWTVACLELVGNAYWLLDKLYGKQQRFPGALQILIPSRITIVPDTTSNQNFIAGYKYSKTDGTSILFTNEEITHFKYIRPNDYFYGQGSVLPSALSIDLIREAETTNLNLFRNGAMPHATLEAEKPIDAIRFDRLKKQFEEGYTGTKNAKKTILLDNGIKFKQISQSMQDLEFIEGIKLSREEICIAFKVPPVILGILDHATYSNYEQANKIFWIHCLMPKLRRLEQVISTIIKRFDPSLCFGFDLSNVESLKENQDLMSQIAQRYFSMGVPMNDIIKALNLPLKPIEGGDIGYLPFSMTPISEVGKKPEQLPAPTEQELETEEPEDESQEEPKSKSWLFRKQALYKQFDRLTRNIESSYKKAIDRHFSELEAQTISELNNKSYMPNNYIKKFDKDKEIDKWMRTSKKYHKFTFNANGKRETENLGLSSVSFDLSNPRAVKWLHKYSLDKATEVIDSLYGDIKSALDAGIEAGESIPDITNRIKATYDGYKENGYKAERIARTEVIGASNAGAIESYKQTGLKLKKGWLCATDERTRDSHLKAGEDYSEEKAIDLDAMFMVGGFETEAPGQTGDGGEDINCRCAIFAVRDNGE
jgi:HK97 family phage portal protein